MDESIFLFVAYVEATLCPALRPGQVVVLAGAPWALSVHKDRRVRAAVEAAGCRLIFLPPYSPDFSPIELAWSKHPEGTRAALRQAGARAQDALDAAIDCAVAAITPRDARGFFRHCGHPLAQ